MLAYMTNSLMDASVLPDRILEETTHATHPDQSTSVERRNGTLTPTSIGAEKRKRVLIGSSPPQCVDQCKPCNPCVRVIVPIRSASRRLPNEYYPEAWRCQCGSNQYDP